MWVTLRQRLIENGARQKLVKVESKNTKNNIPYTGNIVFPEKILLYVPIVGWKNLCYLYVNK